MIKEACLPASRHHVTINGMKKQKYEKALRVYRNKSEMAKRMGEQMYTEREIGTARAKKHLPLMKYIEND